jgi:hypothetical protein
MTASRATWLWLGLGLAIVVGLPILGHWARRNTDPGCALDGVRIDPVYRVEIVADDDHRHVFCCIRCAEIWLQKRPAAQAILVTDEPTGEPIDAGSAYYVRSGVVTTPTTGNRIHVFRHRADAERHAAQFLGTVLTGSERPFARPSRDRQR